MFQGQPQTGVIVGTLAWFKPEVKNAASYPAAFNSAIEVEGFVYNVPTPAHPAVLSLPKGGIVSFTGGALNPAITPVSVTLDAKNKVIANPPVPKFSLTMTTSTGMFKGNFLDTGTNKLKAFEGVLLQPENRGTGFFKGNLQQTGSVELDAVP
jgi:hypothetical protein